MSQAASTETSSRRRRANSRQLNKIFDEWDRLSQPFNEDELRYALSEATECFKIQQQLDESYLETSGWSVRYRIRSGSRQAQSSPQEAILNGKSHRKI